MAETKVEKKEKWKSRRAKNFCSEKGVVLVCTNALISGVDVLMDCFVFMKSASVDSVVGVPFVRCSCMLWSLPFA